METGTEARQSGGRAAQPLAPAPRRVPPSTAAHPTAGAPPAGRAGTAVAPV